MKLSSQGFTMAGVLRAAIFCVALWVCCTALAPRLQPPDTRASDAVTPVRIPDEQAARQAGRATHSERRAASGNTPSVAADTPSVTADTPSVTTDTPSVTADTPSVTADTPSVTADTPSVTADTPSVTADTPSVTAETPSVTADTHSVTADTPSVTADTPLMTADRPLMTADKPSVINDTPSVINDTPPMTADTPSVAADTPLMTADTLSVAADTPLMTADTLSMASDMLSVTADTLSVTADTPSMTADTPSVITDIPPLTADTLSVIADAPSVITDIPPLTADTLSVTADAPSVTANTRVETSPKRRGLRTGVEGGRFVYSMNNDYLEECSSPPRTQYLNEYLDLGRGTLKMDFNLDNVTQAAVPGLPSKRCTIGIMPRGGATASSSYELVIKILHLEFNMPEKLFHIDIHADNYVTSMSFTDRLELPRLTALSVNPVYLNFAWLRLPKVFSMEMEFTAIHYTEGDRYQQVTMTSPVTGFVRTPYWDGVSAYMGILFKPKVNNEKGISVPYGLRAMTSWEHLGVGGGKLCDRVFLNEIRNEPGDYGYNHHYCGSSIPPPMLLAWTTYAFSVRFLKALEWKDIFTGYSLRFSFHNASALPQQLADKTWNCSVAHWPDFKQHLQCNLLTECAGGEDEADCPYTNRACRHGYMAAGGSCFTFGLNPKDSMSWTEADAACRRRGARLPTLNTPAKWRAVLNLLSHRGWENIYIGLSSVDPSLPDMYSHFLQWSDSSVAYYTKASFIVESQCKPCAFLKKTRRPDFVYLDSCFEAVTGNLMCEEIKQGSSQLRVAALITEIKPLSRINSTRCPKGHVTHNFMSCDPQCDCLTNCYTPFSATLSSLPPVFKCHNGFERVPFTLVCDHREDCSDASDEICVFPPCQDLDCNNKQCTARHQTCDKANRLLSTLNFSRALPAMVLHDGKGLYDLLDIADIAAHSTSSDNHTVVEGCPTSHFQCPGVSYYCLPVYVRCNGVNDCPGHEDEADCDNMYCPGYYRCRRSKVCLHGDQLCDGIFQCPQRDDELMCGFVCPVGCTCYGLAFFCNVSFDASRHAGLRFLDADGSGMSLQGLLNNTMLFYLSLARCNITQLETMNLLNVFHLDLSENSITTLLEKHISLFQNLQVLVIARNPLRRILEDSSPGQGAFLAKLHTLDLSAATITAAQMVNLHVFSNVTNLNLSNTGLDAVSGFSVFSKLQVLDLRGCPVTYFTRSVFKGLGDLSTVYADNYKLCCPETLPDGFNVLHCYAPFDEVSSCEGLPKSVLYRVGLSVLTAMTLMGNAGSFVYLVFINRPKQQSSFGLFVTNLCLSDFLMGVYSAIIGVADRMYLRNYVWNDVTWRRSVMCKMAGVLSLVSNEVSVLIICLITVDRLLVTRFPFSLHLHFSPRSARVACVTAWSIGVLLAVTPLLPVTSHWQLYSHTGICIPLPVIRKAFVGRDYSFGILIILNFVLFLVIASGQMLIYLSIRANSMTTSDSTQKAKDLTIARRLITVAVSDFLCWFPVGFLGMLSSRGHPIPGEASVVIAVFVLPLNSALNPFLYTVNVILERRQRAREQRLQKIILARHGGRLSPARGKMRHTPQQSDVFTQPRAHNHTRH